MSTPISPIYFHKCASFRTSLAPPLAAQRDNLSLLKPGEKEKVGLAVTMLARFPERIQVKEPHFFN